MRRSVYRPTMYKTSKLFWPVLLLVDFIGYILFFWVKFFKHPQSPKKILIIRLDHIGDMILTSSFIHNLRSIYPKSEITVLCRSNVAEVAKMIPEIGNIDVLNTPWFSRKDSCGWLNAAKYVFRNFRKYDLAFEMHIDPLNILLAKLVSRYTVGYGVRGMGFLLNKMISYPRSNKDKKHIVEMNLDLLRALGNDISNKVSSSKLELNVSDKIFTSLNRKMNKLGLNNILNNIIRKNEPSDKTVSTAFSDLIVIFPFSARKNKDWNGDWNKINSFLLKKFKGSTILYLSGPENYDLIASAVKCSSHIINAAGSFSISETIALISESRLVISIDTFAVHAASAFNKKIVCMYGPTLASEWGPYMNDNALAIQGAYNRCKGCEQFSCKFSENILVGRCVCTITEKVMIYEINSCLGKIP